MRDNIIKLFGEVIGYSLVIFVGFTVLSMFMEDLYSQPITKQEEMRQYCEEKLCSQQEYYNEKEQFTVTCYCDDQEIIQTLNKNKISREVIK